eukprot:gi/632979496/ref/XP_007906502.1/ PREDICTED: proline-rich protein 22 [Callorhinchus milii]
MATTLSGFHVAPCGCLYDPRIHNIGSNGGHCDLPSRLSSPYYGHNFILNPAPPVSSHPDLHPYLPRPLYYPSPGQNSPIYQSHPQVYFQQAPIRHSGRNQLPYSGSLSPFSGKAPVATRVQTESGHQPRASRSQSHQPPKASKQEEVRSKVMPEAPIQPTREDVPAQQAQAVPQALSPQPSSKQLEQGRLPPPTLSGKGKLMDDEEQMLAALDAVSEEELHQLPPKGISGARCKASGSGGAQGPDTLPEEVSLEEAMKLFDCIPFHNVSLSSSPAPVSVKLSSSGDLSDYKTDSDSSEDTLGDSGVASVTELAWHQPFQSVSHGKSCEDSLEALGLPSELLSPHYDVPEIADIVTTMEFFYSVSIYGLLNEELSNWNSHLAFYSAAKDASYNHPSGGVQQRPGEASPGADTTAKTALDLVRKEKRQQPEVLSQQLAKKGRFADSAALEAVQEFCAVSMSATMKRRLGIEDQ